MYVYNGTSDTLGAGLLSFIQRLSSGGRFEIILNIYDYYYYIYSTIVISIGAIASVLYIEVVFDGKIHYTCI